MFYVLTISNTLVWTAPLFNMMLALFRAVEHLSKALQKTNHADAVRKLIAKQQDGAHYHKGVASYLVNSFAPSALPSVPEEGQENKDRRHKFALRAIRMKRKSARGVGEASPFHVLAAKGPVSPSIVGSIRTVRSCPSSVLQHYSTFQLRVIHCMHVFLA